MKEIRIKEADIYDLKVSSLPSRPTAPRSLGGCGYTAADMKAAFDKLPLFIVERFNLLLESIAKEGDGSVAANIPTGIKDGHTLSDLLGDVLTGVFATYLSVSGTPLSESITLLKAQIEQSLALVNANDARLAAQSETVSAYVSTVAAHTGELSSLGERMSASETKISHNEAKIEEMMAESGKVDLENILIDCGSAKDRFKSEEEV